MEKLLLKIEDLKNEIAQLDPISGENRHTLWEKFRLEWNYNSNHLEGNTLTFVQTKSLFHFKDEFIPENVSLREVHEMQGHDFALQHLNTLLKDSSRHLTQTDICELNETILVKPYWKNALTPSGEPARKQIIPGKYKEQPNHVRLNNGQIFKYAEPHEVPAKMEELLDWYRTESTLDSVSKAALLHYKFVIIHPFDDGNGRVSRLLMNYHLMRNDLPPVIIKSEDKQNYRYALTQADAGNLGAFTKYIANQLLWSLDISLKATRGESIEEDADLDKKIDLYVKKLESQKPTSSRRNNGVCVELYELSIDKLFNEIERELMKISSIFVTVRMRRFFNMINSDRINSENLERFKGEAQKDNLNKFMMSVFCSEIENGNKNKNIQIQKNISVDLNLYTYEIKLSDNRKIENSYSEPLSIHEMNLIADDVKRSIFTQIEKHS